ncbi:MAG TPA: hypothetical protein VHS56_11730 [Candidatus Cybelea sp.]|jgi:hypothetical protein|nr:hypothetical protein [Candidatus Cybelea sp.]
MPDLSLAAAALTACGLFGANGAYTQSVSASSVDPNSQRYIKSAIGAGASSGFSIAAKPVEFVNLADNRTPTFRVRPKVRWHTFSVPYPWGPGFRIEPLSDAHAIVVQTQSCRLYELYNASFAANVLSAYGGTVWNLRSPFATLPAGKSSAMASGLSLYAGAVAWEEIARGVVPHALNMAIAAGSAAQWDFVRPASNAEAIPFKGHTGYALPYGAHLRLRDSFDISRFGRQSAAIARAMKTYGLYVADTARSNQLYSLNALDGSHHWDARDLAALSSIHLSDFQVLSLGKIQRVPGH